MAEPFKLCILFGDDPDRPPSEIAPGWEMAEVPVALQLVPFESNANWERRRAEIASYGLPPIRASSHFIQSWGLTPVGPDVDWEQLEFWTKRAFERLGQLGVEVVGVYGDFFRVPPGFSRAEALDQAMRFANLLADHAGRHGMLVALEPTANADTLWPMYADAVAFAKAIGRPEIRAMADLAYFIRGGQDLRDIAREPDYCVHCHIAGDGGQPGVGDRRAIHKQLFRILRDMGYTRGVSAACPWVSTTGGKLEYGLETARALAYLRQLREEVYGE